MVPEVADALEETRRGTPKELWDAEEEDEELSPAFKDPDGEITAARFVTVDEALKLLSHPKDREFLQSIRSKIEG